MLYEKKKEEWFVIAVLPSYAHFERFRKQLEEEGLLTGMFEAFPFGDSDNSEGWDWRGFMECEDYLQAKKIMDLADAEEWISTCYVLLSDDWEEAQSLTGIRIADITASL